MIRYLAALVTATIAGVAGVWLVLAPLALGYPEGRAYGSMAGRVDLATGGGLCAVAALTGVVWAIAWRRRMRTDGVLPRRTSRPAARTVIAAIPPEEAQTQAIAVPEQARAASDGASATAVMEAPAPGPGADGAQRDFQSLIAPLVDALTEDAERARYAGAVAGAAGRPADDYAEETW